MSKSNNEQINAYKWVGDETLPLRNNEPHYFFETIGLVSRGEKLLENGILNRYFDVLYLSALTEFLIITRSLLEKYLKQNLEDTDTRNRCNHIAHFRNGLCHTESLKNVVDKKTFIISSIPANYDGSVPWVLKNGQMVMKDGRACTSEELVRQCDDIIHRQGNKQLWIKKELIRDFYFVRDYFAQKLPCDYAFQVRCRNFRS